MWELKQNLCLPQEPAREHSCLSRGNSSGRNVLTRALRVGTKQDIPGGALLMLLLF